jgi:hypothetical protein
MTPPPAGSAPQAATSTGFQPEVSSAGIQTVPNSSDPLHLDEEIDLWWGSYAGRAMAPSFAVCLVLTALIIGGARWLVPELGWHQLTVTALTSSVWLVQLWRWGRRFFGYNYRLTSRFLYVDRGLLNLVARRFPLRLVSRVEARSDRLQGWLGIGDIVVQFDDVQHSPAVLEALVTPAAVAVTIREAVSKARGTAP